MSGSWILQLLYEIDVGGTKQIPLVLRGFDEAAFHNCTVA